MTMQYSSKAFMFAISTFVVVVQASSGSVTTCTGPGGVDIRTIEVVHATEATLPCTTLYTKQTQTNEIASAEVTEGYCDAVGDNVITNLEAASFDCVSEAEVDETMADELATAATEKRVEGVPGEVEAE